MFKVYKHTQEGWTGATVEANDAMWQLVGPEVTSDMVVEIQRENIGVALLIEDANGARFTVTPGPVN